VQYGWVTGGKWQVLKASTHPKAAGNNRRLGVWLRILIRCCKPVSCLKSALSQKEANMRYKTIVLELLQQHPEIHNQLRSKRMLLPAMELYARQLRTRHEAWMEHLSRTKPGSDQSQIVSEALEIALKELENSLGIPEDSEPLSVEAAMAFIRDHVPQRRQ